MLDRDLADLYGVETKQLKRVVRRNIARFPRDFMFELTKEEYDFLRLQFGTFKKGHSRYWNRNGSALDIRYPVPCQGLTP